MALNNRANVYRDRGDTGRAVADYGKAIESNPKYDLAYLNRGLTYLYSGDPDKALADINQASELDPKDPLYALWVDILNKRSNLRSRLAEATAQLDMTKWPAPVIRLFLGQMTRRRRTRRRRRCRCQRHRHERRQRLAIPRRHGQAEFRAPPQNVVRKTRPFLCHEIAHLRARQFRPEGRTEVGPAFGVAKHGLKTRAIGGDQTLRLSLGQKPPALARAHRPRRRTAPTQNRRPAAAPSRSSAATSDRTA